jgi:hypothetical protein
MKESNGLNDMKSNDLSCYFNLIYFELSVEMLFFTEIQFLSRNIVVEMLTMNFVNLSKHHSCYAQKNNTDNILVTVSCLRVAWKTWIQRTQKWSHSQRMK